MVVTFDTEGSRGSSAADLSYNVVTTDDGLICWALANYECAHGCMAVRDKGGCACIIACDDVCHAYTSCNFRHLSMTLNGLTALQRSGSSSTIDGLQQIMSAAGIFCQRVPAFFTLFKFFAVIWTVLKGCVSDHWPRQNCICQRGLASTRQPIGLVLRRCAKFRYSFTSNPPSVSSMLEDAEDSLFH